MINKSVPLGSILVVIFTCQCFNGLAFAETEQRLSAPEPNLHITSPEKQLSLVFEALQSLNLKQAIQLADELVEDYPNYKMAQAMKADLLALQSGQHQLLSSMHHLHPKAIESFAEEKALRWQFLHQAGASSVAKNRNWLVKTSRSGYFVLINAQTHRLYLYQQSNAGLAEIDNFYISLGRAGAGKQRRGDLKTPIGIYLIESWKAGKDLPDLYGDGALTLNYPNAWDQYQGKTGSGIWLHGTPSDTFTRAPLASKGCVVLTNPAITKLRKTYALGENTPVMIVDEAAPVMANLDVLNEIQRHLQQTRPSADWSSLSVMRYPGEDNLYYSLYHTQSGELIDGYWQSQSNGWQLVLQPHQNSAQLALK